MPFDADFSKLHEQSEQNRLDFLRTDLDLIRTLINLAESKLKVNNRDHAVDTFANATKGYWDMCRIFKHRNSWEDEPTKEIEERLAVVRQELDRVQQLVHPTR